MYWAESENYRRWAAQNPLALAFGLSLILHLLLFGGWRLGKQLHWWEHQAAWLLKINQLKQPSVPPTARSNPPKPPKEIPLTFAEVDPTLAATEAPKNAKYYGAHNSIAANPDALIETTTPKIDGKQDKVMRTEDVPKPKPFPLQPAAPPETKPAEAEAKPKAAENPGDLALAKPAELKVSNGIADAAIGDAPAPPREKPRTLAMARQQNNMLAGEKIKQDGGTRQRGRIVPSVKATPFGTYDAAFIAAVQQRWYDLLDNGNFTQRSGKVVLQFHLNYDGRITDMEMTDNNVGELLALICQKAVLDPAPYAKWPSDMRRMIGENFREVTFTFYYN
jgi:hypothetical protein